MRTLIYRIAILLTVGALLTPAALAFERPRVIVTTDGERDDMCSMIRFLLHADFFETEGLIYTSSEYHSIDHHWNGTTWIQDYIDKYAEAYPNLKKHSQHFPTPQSLRSRVYVGNIAAEGDMSRPTAGSNRIVDVLLEDDPRPVYLQAWGGVNTIARALKTIQEEHPDQMERVAHKAIIHQIAAQDNTGETYLKPNWPKVYENAIHNNQFPAMSYGWKDKLDPHTVALPYYSLDWLETNIINDHGSLCAEYLVKRSRGLRSEGDSPAFMHQMDVGLRSLQHPSYGGWGGRFEFNERQSYWRGAPDDGDLYKAIWRWIPHFQNEFGARADWCVTGDLDGANHPPVVKLGHDADLTVRSGEQVRLSAVGTSDPDGDDLTYLWWQYSGPGSLRESEQSPHPSISIAGAKSPNASFVAPAGAGTIHIILQVTDQGTPALTRYQRVIVTVTP